ncbi:MAG: hypothetical protein BWX80_03088 [Candidatus Hydrogenedentes bacterium ADurb.Bin101]|nr:MAG: hypothetical protein BWX80_03088 [Candidatus Hydrogenedentes bacterium ADurb.Bin101]
MHAEGHSRQSAAAGCHEFFALESQVIETHGNIVPGQKIEPEAWIIRNQPFLSARFCSERSGAPVRSELQTKDGRIQKDGHGGLDGLCRQHKKNQQTRHQDSTSTLNPHVKNSEDCRNGILPLPL